MADLAKLVEELSALTVMEAADLSKMLEEKWGVSAAAPLLLRLPAVLLPQLKKRPNSTLSSLKPALTKLTLLRKSAALPLWV